VARLATRRTVPAFDAILVGVCAVLAEARRTARGFTVSARRSARSFGIVGWRSAHGPTRRSAPSAGPIALW